MASSHESPYGLTWFDASGSVELTKAPLGSAYREFYQHAVQIFDPSIDNDPPIDKSEIASLFRTAVVPLTEHLRNESGHTPEYVALFSPSVFSFPTRTAAVDGVLGEHFDQPMKDGPARQATCDGYGFL